MRKRYSFSVYICWSLYDFDPDFQLSLTCWMTHIKFKYQVVKSKKKIRWENALILFQCFCLSSSIYYPSMGPRSRSHVCMFCVWKLPKYAHKRVLISNSDTLEQTPMPNEIVKLHLTEYSALHTVETLKSPRFQHCTKSNTPSNVTPQFRVTVNR